MPGTYINKYTSHALAHWRRWRHQVQDYFVSFESGLNQLVVKWKFSGAVSSGHHWVALTNFCPEAIYSIQGQVLYRVSHGIH